MLAEEKLHLFRCKGCNRTVCFYPTEIEKCKPWGGPYCTKCGRRLKAIKK